MRDGTFRNGLETFLGSKLACELTYACKTERNAHVSYCSGAMKESPGKVHPRGSSGDNKGTLSKSNAWDALTIPAEPPVMLSPISATTPSVM